MAAEIPTTEPATIRAGDSVTWTRGYTDYTAADGWTLHYSFRKKGAGGTAIDFDCTTSGALFLASIAAASSADWIPGIYSWVAYVTKADDRYTVGSGDTLVLLNLQGGDASSTDPRTKAERILDFIDRSWERVAQKQVVSSSVEGVNLQFRSIDDLIKARNYWQQIVNAERAAANGSTKGNLILARFVSPR